MQTEMTETDAPNGAQAVAGCRLLTLPAELPNRIYELAVVEEKGIHILLKRPYPTSPAQPAVLRLNKVIRNEALPVFFGCNTFHIKYDLGSESSSHVFSIVRKWLTANEKHIVRVPIVCISLCEYHPLIIRVTAGSSSKARYSVIGNEWDNIRGYCWLHTTLSWLEESGSLQNLFDGAAERKFESGGYIRLFKMLLTSEDSTFGANDKTD